MFQIKLGSCKLYDISLVLAVKYRIKETFARNYNLPSFTGFQSIPDLYQNSAFEAPSTQSYYFMRHCGGFQLSRVLEIVMR